MKEKLSIIGGIILILHLGVIKLMSSARVAFSAPVAVLAIIMILYGFKGKSIKQYIDKKIYLKKIIKICLVCFSAVFIIIEGIIISYPKHDTSDAEYILVLGAGLRDGYEPSTILSDRLNAAIYCAETYGDTGKIVVSGGKGSDEKISEAEAMKKYLIDKGISAERILVENNSENTKENFRFSKEVIEEDSGKSIADINVKIVTTDFHAFRSRMLAERNGYEKITNYSSHTVWYLIPISYLREAFALVKSVIFD